MPRRSPATDTRCSLRALSKNLDEQRSRGPLAMRRRTYANAAYVQGEFLRRLHLFELHEQSWLPNSLRDAVTDILQWVLNLTKTYAAVEPRLRAALKHSRASQVVDLCSGAGGPWLWMQERLAAQKTPVEVWLTDKYPNQASLRTIQKRMSRGLRYYLSPVKATQIPSDLQGFRTLFTAFHHFRPEEARALVQEAVDRREGIAIFEVPKRSIMTVVGCLLFPLGALLAVPLMRPFRWSRLFWTYLIPLAPLILCFDGLVSCLRAYSIIELSEIAQSHAAKGYRWQFGEEQRGRFSFKVTYLVGSPKNPHGSTRSVFSRTTGTQAG